MNLAFWCILIAGILPIATVAIAKGGGDYGNRTPRASLEQRSGLRQRADFAHRNHFEAFPFFAAAVLVAVWVHAPQARVNGLAVAFIVLRLAYTAAYLMDRPTLRSTLWTAAYACVVALFIVASMAH